MPAVFGLLVLALWAYCLIDALTTPRGAARHLPKLVWVLVIVVASVPGAVAWLVLGRPRREHVVADVSRGGGSQPRVMGPEDAPDFEERLQRGLRRQQQPPPDSD
jgi:hypothetical protein